MNNRKTKHTEGPWTIVPSRYGYGIRAGLTNLCQVSALEGHETQDGDARLIASAPEMLEALEWILGHVGRCTTKEHLTDEYGLGKIKTPYGVGTVVDAHLILEKVKSAITKVTGGES